MKKWLNNGGDCLVSKTLLSQKGKLLWAWRESPLTPQDSGWRFLSDIDSQTTLMNGDNTKFVNFNQVANIEPLVVCIYWYPIGADFQFSDYQGVKHFVYNDTFSPVKLVDSVADLPVQSPDFQKHFSDYPQENTTDTLIQPHTVQAQSQLNTSQQELDVVSNIFLAMRTDKPSELELYIMSGLLLGYLMKRSQTLPIDWKKQRVALSNLLISKFKAKDQVINDFIDSFMPKSEYPPIGATNQILSYGKAMYDWYNSEQFEKIHNEYVKLIMHHQRVKD